MIEVSICNSLPFGPIRSCPSDGAAFLFGMIPVIVGDQGGPNFGRSGHKLTVGHPCPFGDPDKPEKLPLPLFDCPAAGASFGRCTCAPPAPDFRQAVGAVFLVGARVYQLYTAPQAITDRLGFWGAVVSIHRPAPLPDMPPAPGHHATEGSVSPLSGHQAVGLGIRIVGKGQSNGEPGRAAQGCK